MNHTSNLYKKRLPRRILAMAMTVCMVFTMSPPITVAAEKITDDGNIRLSGFVPLPKEIREQSVTPGTSPDELNLPEALKATVDTSNGDMAWDDKVSMEASPSDAEDATGSDAEEDKHVTISGITWESNPLYDTDAPGTYLFTAVLPSGYTVEDGVAMPEITVTVEKSAVDKVITMIDALPAMEEWLAMDEVAARAVMDEILAAKKAYDGLTNEEKALIDEIRTGKLIELAQMAQQLAGMMPMAADHDHTGWTEWTASDSMPTTPGNYYLANNVTLSESPYISGKGVLNLCLNGKTIDCGSNRIEKYCEDYSESILNLYDESAGDGKITAANADGVTIDVDYTYSRFHLYGGKIENTLGTAIAVKAAKAYLHGGAVSGEKYGVDASGGGLYLSGSPTIMGKRADIFTNTSDDPTYTGIKANDGEDTPSYYTGGQITVEPLFLLPASMYVIGGIKDEEQAAKFMLVGKCYSIYDSTNQIVTLGVNAITQAPAVENEYTVIASEKATGYQWYRAEDSTRVLGENDVVASAGEETISTYDGTLNGGEGGWTKPYDTNLFLMFFAVHLEAGETFSAKFGGFNSVAADPAPGALQDMMAGAACMLKADGNTLSATVSQSGDYMLMVIPGEPDADRAAAYIYDVKVESATKLDALSGQTSTALTDFSTPGAVCEVTFENGYKEDSTLLAFPYAITFHSNGLTGSVGSIYGSTGDTRTLPGGDGLSGGTFEGWSTQSDGGGISYAAGDTVTFGNADIQLYAKVQDTSIAQGITGGCTWRIDADGTLNIFPTNGTSGTLPAFSSSDQPWNSQKASIKAVKVESGVKANANSGSLFSDLTVCTTMDLSGLDTTDVTNMQYMFNKCSGLTSLNLSSFNTEKVTAMGNMFNGCSSLTSLDLSKFDTLQVTNMDSMFYGCSGLTSLDLSKFDTAKVMNMASMFSNCSKLASITFGDSFSTANVTNMGNMFDKCKGLTSLDLSKFDFTKVANMTSMLYSCNLGLNTDFYKKTMSDTGEIYLYNKHSKDDLTTTDLTGSETNIFYMPYAITKSATNGTITTSSKYMATHYSTYFKKISGFSGAPTYDSAKNYAQLGETVTIKLAPTSGYAVDTVTVTQGGMPVTLSGTGNTRTFTMPAGDVTITAAFKSLGYPVTINANKDGSAWSGHGKTFKLSSDNGSTFVPDLTKVADGTYTVYEGSTNTGVTVTVSGAAASATVDYYTVTFYDDGTPYSTPAPQAVLKTVGRVTAPTNPSKTGYTFAGWKTADDATAFEFATVAITAATGVYASWTANTYTVTLNGNDGTGTALASYTYDVGATLPTDWTKTGYTFKGWHDNSGLAGNAVTAISSTDIGDKEYWAKWEVISVSNVSLNKTSATLVTGETEALTATVSPADAANKSVTWGSNNESVATVSGGTVTAVDAGTATITVTTVDGSKTATCTVTVSKNDAQIIAAAKTAAENAVYADTTQAATGTEEAAKAYVENIATTAVNTGGVTVTATKVSYIAPVDGTSADPAGTNGSYVFTVTVTKGAQSETTVQKTLTITVTAFTGITDVQAVAAATAAIVDGTVNIAFGATQTDKTTAVQTYVNNLLAAVPDAADVTATVTYSSASDYNVALNKGSVNDSKTITMTVNVNIASGISNTCSWRIDEDGLLIIWPTKGVSGTLDSYSSSTQIPWKNNLADVKKVQVQSGVNTDYYAIGLFSGLVNCTEIDLTGLNTTKAEKLTELFHGCTSLTSLTFGSSFKTEEVIDMSGMFSNCKELTNLDISGFDTQKVTNAGNMFNGMESLISITMGNSFSTGTVTTLGGMFTGCSSLTELDLSKFNTSNVTNMKNMFQNCSKLTSLDLSSFTNPNATSMLELFEGCTDLETIVFGNDFSTASVKSMNSMFKNCSALKSLDVSSFNTSKVTDMLGMFEGCSELTAIDLSSFDTSAVTDMDKMFSGCTALSALDLSKFSTAKLQYTSSMFDNCTLGLKTEFFKTNMKGKKIYLYGKNSKSDLTNTDLTGSEGNIVYRPYAITKTETTNGSFTVSSDGEAENYFTKTASFYTDAPAYDSTKSYAQLGKTVTITPTPDIGYVLDTLSVTKGGTTITTTPSGSSYTFTMPADEVTVTTSFKPGEYEVTITVNKDNAQWSDSGKSFKLSKDDGASFITDLTKVLNGTYTIYEMDGTSTGVSVTINNAEASAAVDYYTVTFYDGATAYSTPAPQVVLKTNGRVTAPADPAKTGYTFAGWKTTNDGTTAFNFTNKAITAATGVYASWTANTYTVTLNGDGGTGTALTSYTYAVGATLPSDWTKQSYIFAGWYSDSSFSGSPVTAITVTDIEDKEFWAKWTPVSVTGVSLDQTGITLVTGETETLTATVLPDNAFNKNVTWTSDNTGVATVANGVVTAVNVGTATITVTTADGSKTASCIVTVNPNDTQIVAAAKEAAENADYAATTQAATGTEEAAKAYVENIATTAVNNSDVTVAVNKISYTAPMAGTSADPDGTDGSYVFTITVSKGTLSDTTTQKTLIITATAFTGITDVQAVAAAKDAVIDGIVDIGFGATQATKTAAVQTYVNGLLTGTPDAAGVVATVTYNSGTGKYDVALSKGSVTSSKTITVTVNEAPDPDIAIVADAKTAAETATYAATTQAATDTEEAAKAYVENIATTAVNNSSVTVTVDQVSYTAPVAGTRSNREGTNGSYTFTVTVSKGTQSQTTIQLTIIIMATAYSGSSSDDDDSTTSKPVEPVTGSTENKAAVDDKGNANVTITNKNIADTITNAMTEANKKGVNPGEITAVINVTTEGKDAAAVSVNLPKVVQDQIIGNKIAKVEFVIDRPDLTIGMNLAAVTEINRQANGDVQVSAGKTNAAALSAEAKTAIGNRPAYDLRATWQNGGKSVQNFGTGAVSIEIPYKLQSGETAGNIYAVHVDGNGKVTYLPNSGYDVNRETLVFSTNHFSVYGVGFQANTPKFTDITNHWAKDEIEFAVSRGLISGTGNTSFSPDSAMTRGMFVTALGRLAGVDVSSYKTSSFGDVKADSYYRGYIEWSSKNNILTGIGGGNFAPDSPVTREQMAVAIERYATVTGFKLPEAHEAHTFADYGKISTWAWDAIKRVRMAGIITGKTGNKFDPQGAATRAEVSAVLKRFVELTAFSDTAQGWKRNDSGKWMYYENGKAVTGQKTIGGIVYQFNSYGEIIDTP